MTQKNLPATRRAVSQVSANRANRQRQSELAASLIGGGGALRSLRAAADAAVGGATVTLIVRPEIPAIMWHDGRVERLAVVGTSARAVRRALPSVEALYRNIAEARTAEEARGA